MEDIEHCKDGSVCGCPEWWGICADPTLSTPSADEASLSPVLNSSGPENQMCFFWYHYRVCKRPKWRRPCPYKHELIPLGTVQTPRGTFRHDRPCDLPLCPLRNDVQKPDIVVLEQPSDPSRFRRAHLNQQSSRLDTRTCFFWYHGGKCAKRPCNFHHRVSPSCLVEPPPGYVHHEPCYLPLCPLSEPLFRQVSTPDHRGKSTKAMRKQRYCERKRLKALGLIPNTSTQKACKSNKHKDSNRPLISLRGRRADSPTIRLFSSPESGELFSDEEPPDEAWFLEGFPDAAPEGGEGRVAQVGDVVEVMKWEVEAPEADELAGLAGEEVITGKQACVGGQELTEGVERELEGGEKDGQNLTNFVGEALWTALGGE